MVGFSTHEFDKAPEEVKKLNEELVKVLTKFREFNIMVLARVGENYVDLTADEVEVLYGVKGDNTETSSNN